MGGGLREEEEGGGVLAGGNLNSFQSKGPPGVLAAQDDAAEKNTHPANRRVVELERESLG